MEAPKPSVQSSDMAIASSCCAILGLLAIQCVKLLPEGHLLQKLFSDQSLLVPLSAITTSVLTFALSRLKYYVERRQYRLEYLDILNTFDELIEAANLEDTKVDLMAKKEFFLMQRADELLKKMAASSIKTIKE
ncbi:hypothetical protein [Photobacterium kishitanii]|uniref:hypothetical protein n=1 Tax=Photobacterium kishitanii TaxID=318456 RepID=UPI0004326067|nr:hypothetical protein [Photobacterium kishitanii]CEO39376.1 hypothetical protein PPBDW_I21392 [Photobacterium kishitanii]